MPGSHGELPSCLGHPGGNLAEGAAETSAITSALFAWTVDEEFLLSGDLWHSVLLFSLVLQPVLIVGLPLQAEGQNLIESCLQCCLQSLHRVQGLFQQDIPEQFFISY